MALKLRDRIVASPAGSERALVPAEMLALARSVDLVTLDLAEYRRFDECQYARSTIFLNEHVELVAICWLPDQASSIHDHGKSNCLYLVVDGEMREEMFELNDQGRPRRLQARGFERGAITIAAPHDVHRIMNPGPAHLVTLHIYSPPLDESVTNFTPIPRREPRQQTA
jgi:cysteine dioxygenase